jgi:hypothetical protein
VSLRDIAAARQETVPNLRRKSACVSEIIRCGDLSQEFWQWQLSQVLEFKKTLRPKTITTTEKIMNEEAGGREGKAPVLL